MSKGEFQGERWLRIRVESGGTGPMTSIYDLDTGERLLGVREVEIRIRPLGRVEARLRCFCMDERGRPKFMDEGGELSLLEEQRVGEVLEGDMLVYGVLVGGGDEEVVVQDPKEEK